MEDKNQVTPGEIRIKRGDYIFNVYELENNSVRVDCENRATFSKYSSGDVILQKLKPQTISFALQETQQAIKCEIVDIDAKIILNIKVDHQFLALISESVELNQISGSLNDPAQQILSKISFQIEDIKEDMKNLCSNQEKGMVQDMILNDVTSNILQICALPLNYNGDYIVNLNYNLYAEEAEPDIIVTAILKGAGQREKIVWQEQVHSQFEFTGTQTFQTIKFLFSKTDISLDKLEISFSSNQYANLSNINVTLLKAN